jgi:drug/metabolite transporter (DMT)-like permease
MDSKLWLVYSILAGLCWGTYVPLVQQGIGGLKSPYGSFLCVGIAYFLIAVLVPVGLLVTVEKTPDWNAYGITFATLAGAAGALGALCVIFANRNVQHSPHDKLYIAPIIFGLAPILNTLISLFWHPKPGSHDAWHFGLEHLPSGKLYLGILLTGIGAALVLYSKEEAESARPAAPAPPALSSGPQQPG